MAERKGADPSKTNSAPSQSTKPRNPYKGSPKSLSDKIKELEDEYGEDTLYQILGKAGDGSAGAGQDGLGQPTPASSTSFPVRLYQRDPYDTTVQLKQAAGKDLGEKVLTQQDLEWLRRKQDAVTAAEFKQFVASMYNLNDPAQVALMHKVYPQLREEQKEIVSQRLDLIKRLTMMAVTGQPESQEDLQLLFALNTGAISLPEGNLWDPSTWTNGEIAAGKFGAMKRGMFSPVKIQFAGTGDQSKMPFDALRWASGPGVGGSQRSLASGAVPGSYLPGNILK